MADYYPLIARAIAGLDPSAPGESRRALYERARAALIAQLRSVQPPLSESEITRERLALEEAVRKVESEAAQRAREASRANSGAARTTDASRRANARNGDAAPAAATATPHRPAPATTPGGGPPRRARVRRPHLHHAMTGRRLDRTSSRNCRTSARLETRGRTRRVSRRLCRSRKSRCRIRNCRRCASVQVGSN